MSDVASAAPAPGLVPGAGPVTFVPTRARGMEMLGALAGSGYRESPRLVRRSDGQLIRLTPLLYDLVEAIDGERDLTALAAELSRRSGRQASADDVRYLIDEKLGPLGVLDEQGGEQPKLARSNPLLALKLRYVVSNPELTRRLTTPFVWLFHPLAMVPLLLGFLGISGWLLLDKGLSSALHQAFHEPGLILVIWALVVLSACFHEIGHAAACRYGGAKPGVIGAGLYLIWPAFYTEVSDCYRLSKGARLRVDLGGLYFSALFAVLTAGLWVLTGSDALLLVIAVQIMQMIRQLAPFIRADGYHIVSDLVGVPDLFAHIKPTLLGLWPKRWGGTRGSALKPWARTVVAGWVAVTVPALAAILAFIVLAFPRIAGTAWSSIGERWAEAGAYWAEGDPAGVVMAVLSIGIVVLPVASIVYLVCYLGRRLARWAWRTTEERPRRRALAIAGMGALAALVAWAWWPGERYAPVEASGEAKLPSILLPPAPDGIEMVTLSASPAYGTTAAPGLPAAQPTYLLAPSSGTVLSEASAAGPLPALLPPEGEPGVTDPLPEREAPAPLPPTQEPQPQPPPPGTTQPLPGEGLSWPFPFDPPDPAGPEDNQVTVVNTSDGTEIWELALSLVIVDDGRTVDHHNEASAFASCTNCVAGAVAFQVVLVVGYAEEIIPENTALAMNFVCYACQTYALAYQIIASVSEAPTAEVQAELDAALAQLQALELALGTLSINEIIAELDGVHAAVMQALGGILAIEPSVAIAGASLEDGGSGEEDAAGRDGSAVEGEADGDKQSPEETVSDPEAASPPPSDTSPGVTETVPAEETTTTPATTSPEGEAVPDPVDPAATEEDAVTDCSVEAACPAPESGESTTVPEEETALAP
jgi:putative peptide zinc metalloprotease protein